jgi:hypothetical protein
MINLFFLFRNCCPANSIFISLIFIFSLSLFWLHFMALRLLPALTLLCRTWIKRGTRLPTRIMSQTTVRLSAPPASPRFEP